MYSGSKFEVLRVGFIGGGISLFNSFCQSKSSKKGCCFISSMPFIIPILELESFMISLFTKSIAGGFRYFGYSGSLCKIL